MFLGSILDNGAVYYPFLFGIPVLVDFAFDEERWSDLAFFVVVGVVLFGLATLVRWLVLRARPIGRAAE